MGGTENSHMLNTLGNQLRHQQEVNQKYIEDTINFERDINKEKEGNKKTQLYLDSLQQQHSSLKAQSSQEKDYEPCTQYES